MGRLSFSGAHLSPVASHRRGQATILCIDDDQTALTLRKTVLERAGYRVLTANTGCCALETAKAKRVDLALVDLDMPDMSGYSVAALLRCTRPGARIVIFSGHDCREVRDLRDELDGCIDKDTPPLRFLEQVAQHVAAGARHESSVSAL